MAAFPTKISPDFVFVALVLLLLTATTPPKAANAQPITDGDTPPILINVLNGVINTTLRCSLNVTGDSTATPLRNIQVTFKDGGRPGTFIIANTSLDGNLFLNFTLGAIFIQLITELNQLFAYINGLELTIQTPIANCSILAGVGVLRGFVVIERIFSGIVFLGVPFFSRAG